MRGSGITLDSDQIREKMKKELQAKLSLSQQSIFKMEAEKSTLSTKIATLEQKKEKLDAELKQEINKLQNRSYAEFFTTALREFEVEKKISEALQANRSSKEVSKYIEKHFPEELWTDGKWIEKEVS